MRAVITALIAGALWLGVSGSPLGGRLEALLYDLRLTLAAGCNPHPLGWDPRLLVVGVEPKSYQALPEHWAFWLRHYTRVARTALDGGARLVVLDFIPTYAPPADRAAFAELCWRYPEQLILVAHWDRRAEKITTPAPELVTLLGVQNLALANLSLDSDGVARAQSVDPVEGPVQYGRSVWSFMGAEVSQRLGRAPLGQGSDLERIYLQFSPTPPPVVPFHNLGSPNWRDRVVLIGSHDRSDQDLVTTPNVSGDLEEGLTSSRFGVDYQAQVINNLLQDAHYRMVPVPLSFALLSALLWGLLWSARRPGLADNLLGLSAALAVWLGASLAWLIYARQLLPLSAGLLGLPCSWAVAMAHRSWREGQARQRLQQTISGYVGPEILREMLAEPESWLRSLNQRREVTMLFSDINHFSTLSEQHPAELVANWLDLHYREMARVIFAHQGTILRFVGDQFMVLFGSPKTLEHPEESAVACARAMHKRLQELRAVQPEGFYDIKIGIHRGSLLLAVIGDDLKRDYTAIGDEANVAARIQDLCKQTGQSTLISQEVYAHLRSTEGLHDQGEWEVKGRQAKVRVYALATELQPPGLG